MINEIIENRFISNLTKQFRRSPLQLNRLHESDAELLNIEPVSGQILAVTTDTIAEEIAVGLYTDPFLIGWMSVMVNLSDLAAVAATPLGIVISQVLPTEYPSESIELLQKGIEAACENCGTFVLGGDTNFGQTMTMTGCAIGTVDGCRLLTRRGCKPGDQLYTTSLLGIGNIYAISAFASSLSPGQCSKPSFDAGDYRPTARLTEARCLANFASACMDTSDGVLGTLDQLMRLNNVGFRINADWQNALHPKADKFSKVLGIPNWLWLAGQHGEFELLFTILRNKEDQFLLASEQIGWNPVRVGEVVSEPSIQIPIHGEQIGLDTARIRNLGNSFDGNIASYINELMNIDRNIRKGALCHVTQ